MVHFPRTTRIVRQDYLRDLLTCHPYVLHEDFFLVHGWRHAVGKCRFVVQGHLKERFHLLPFVAQTHCALLPVCLLLIPQEGAHHILHHDNTLVGE